MKRNTKIVCLALAILLSVSAMGFSAFAVERVAGEVIYSEDFESAADYAAVGWSDATGDYAATYGTSYQAEIVTGVFGGETNHALKLSVENTSWNCVEIVPAAQMDGVSTYTIRATYYLANNESVSVCDFRFGAQDLTAALGDWVGLRGSIELENRGYSYTPCGDGKSGTLPGTQTAYELEIEVDSTAKTVKVYLNNKILCTRTSASGVVGDIGLAFGKGTVYLDNVVVTNGTLKDTGATVDDTLATGSEKERPAAVYTGKQKGETVFLDSFDSATDVSDLYWRTIDNATFTKTGATVELGNSVNGTNCGKFTSVNTKQFNAVEIVPPEAVAPYDSYTLHMTVKLEKDFDRFSVLYNCNSIENVPVIDTADCGFLEFRWSEVKIRNQGLINGKSNAYTDESCKDVALGKAFTLSLEVDRTLGTAYVYINGEYFNFARDINKGVSGIYLVAMDAIGYVDDVMITAGTYDDYTAYLNGGSPDPTGGEDDGEVTRRPVKTKAPVTTEAPVVTTAASQEEESGGCMGVFYSDTCLGAVVLLLLAGAILLPRHRKKETGTDTTLN